MANGRKKRTGEGEEKERKKAKFSIDELTALGEGIERHRGVLYDNRHSTHIERTEAWDDILWSVNAVSLVGRDVPAVKHRWQDIKMHVRKVLDAHKMLIGKTGGGPVPDLRLRSWEQVAADVIQSDIIHGVGDQDIGANPSVHTSTSRVTSHLKAVPARRLPTPAASHVVPSALDVVVTVVPTATSNASVQVSSDTVPTLGDIIPTKVSFSPSPLSVLQGTEDSLKPGPSFSPPPWSEDDLLSNPENVNISSPQLWPDEQYNCTPVAGLYELSKRIGVLEQRQREDTRKIIREVEGQMAILKRTAVAAEEVASGKCTERLALAFESFAKKSEQNALRQRHLTIQNTMALTELTRAVTTMGDSLARSMTALVAIAAAQHQPSPPRQTAEAVSVDSYSLSALPHSFPKKVIKSVQGPAYSTAISPPSSSGKPRTETPQPLTQPIPTQQTAVVAASTRPSPFPAPPPTSHTGATTSSSSVIPASTADSSEYKSTDVQTTPSPHSSPPSPSPTPSTFQPTTGISSIDQSPRKKRRRC